MNQMLNLVDVLEDLIVIIRSKDRIHAPVYDSMLNELEDIRDSLGEEDSDEEE